MSCVPFARSPSWPRHRQRLRHYERRGLLAPARSRAASRRYTVCDLARLDRIAALKGLGLSLHQFASVHEPHVRSPKRLALLV
jgi:DNA-binding transcriptional MerR regulator